MESVCPGARVAKRSGLVGVGRACLETDEKSRRLQGAKVLVADAGSVGALVRSPLELGVACCLVACWLLADCTADCCLTGPNWLVCLALLLTFPLPNQGSKVPRRAPKPVVGS